MCTVRKTYRYHFVVDGEIVYSGITIDPRRREREHQCRWPNGRIERVGAPTSHEEAWNWERRQTARPSDSVA